MAFTHTLTQSITVGNQGISSTKAYTADGKESRSVAIPIAADTLVNIAIDFSLLTNLFMMADQDLTIETNNPSAPIDTISIKANTPYIWNVDQPQANPFTADVTAFYVTNGSSAATTLTIEVLQDATP